MTVENAASRVSIDIDGYTTSTRLKVVQAYHGLQNAGAHTVRVARSSGGKGFHVNGYFADPLTTEQKFRIRETLNDDPNRLRMDRQRAERGLPVDTNWSTKAGNEGERTVYDSLDAALTAMEADARTPHERMAALQNEGRKALRDTEIPHTRLLTGV